MRSSKDIRTLCASCRAEYWDAGYKTISVHAKYKEECDRCRIRMGWTYIIEQDNCKKRYLNRKKPH